MRALIISDIHSNLQALEAVLAAAPPHDLVWNLGDAVGYGANPNEAVEALRKLGGVVVRGNHDRACSGLTSLDDFSQVAAEAVRWTQTVLTDANLEWVRQMPRGPVVPDGLGVSCVHGSPNDEDEYVFVPEDAQAAMRASSTPITFFGHTHRQGGFATNGEESFELRPQYGSQEEADSYELPLRKGARYMLNPGSVGQPRDGDWRAAFALFDDAERMLTWHRVPYDLRAAQKGIRDAGLPDWLAMRLASGQ